MPGQDLVDLEITTVLDPRNTARKSRIEKDMPTKIQGLQGKTGQLRSHET
jgi:hypothetical protein